jgi:hypothetical protein
MMVFFVAALIKIVGDFNLFMRETGGKSLRREIYDIIFDKELNKR